MAQVQGSRLPAGGRGIATIRCTSIGGKYNRAEVDGFQSEG